MNQETLHSLCARFHGKLTYCQSENCQKAIFFPNGTAKNIFQANREDLNALVRLTCVRFGISTGIVENVVQRILESFNQILAILIWTEVQPEDELLKQLLDLIPETTGDTAKPLITDENLPMLVKQADTLFPACAQRFYVEQFKFCAVTLKKWKEAVYLNDRQSGRPLRPLPYLDEEEIGAGSFGRVYRVRIAEQHMEDDWDNHVNRGPMEYARKDFLLHSGRPEQEMMQTILKQQRSHANVMVALASLQYGDAYSLFFDLASCDLDRYLNGEYGRDREAPPDVMSRCAMYRRGVALAGALGFLHDEFQDSEYTNLSCYHLDLKPHNILVFNAYQPSEIWKITDFGLSRIKGRSGSKGQEIVHAPALHKTKTLREATTQLLRQPTQDRNLTLNRRGEGTYLAPECSERDGQVNWASDVWSLGCIFSLVMSYLDNGPSAVVEFQRRREEQKFSDAFYIIDAKKPLISPVVIEWFKELRLRAETNHGGTEYKVVDKTLSFLQEEVLRPQRDERTTAKEVARKLGKYGRLYGSSLEVPRRSTMARMREKLLPSRSVSSDTVRSYQLDLEGAKVQGSLFAPSGDLLVLYSPQQIRAIPTNQIVYAIDRHKSAPGEVTFTAPRGSWEAIALSSRYLCGGLTGESFECHLYPVTQILGLSATESMPVVAGKRVHNPRLGPIKKVVMSPDGTLTAFVVMPKPSKRATEAIVYLAYTPELMDAPSDWSIASQHSRSNSTISTAESDVALPRGNMIIEDFNIPSVAHIRHFDFSNDSNYLFLISQSGSKSLCVRAWDTRTGVIRPKLNIPIQKASSSSEPLFTCCSCLPGEGNLVILCQRRFLIHIGSWRLKDEVHTDLPNIFKMFVGEDDDNLFSLGNGGNDRRLRVYKMSNSDHWTASKLATTDFIDFKSALDTATVIKDDNGNREVLVGTARGKFLAIRLTESASK